MIIFLFGNSDLFRASSFELFLLIPKVHVGTTALGGVDPWLRLVNQLREALGEHLALAIVFPESR